MGDLPALLFYGFLAWIIGSTILGLAVGCFINLFGGEGDEDVYVPRE